MQHKNKSVTVYYAGNASVLGEYIDGEISTVHPAVDMEVMRKVSRFVRFALTFGLHRSIKEEINAKQK